MSALRLDEARDYETKYGEPNAQAIEERGGNAIDEPDLDGSERVVQLLCEFEVGAAFCQYNGRAGCLTCVILERLSSTARPHKARRWQY